MFKLFKKSKPSIKAIAATIEEIHNQFDSASERLLKEANDIISRNKCADKGERLKALGFSKSVPVIQAKESAEKKQIAELIKYYQVYYPNNKFIDENCVKQICEKYGLVFGDACFYKGDIPEKNIKDIEAFQLRDEDKEKRTNIDDYLNRKRMANLFGSPSLGSSIPTKIIERLVQPPFKICAPEKDFDMAYLTKKGYKLEYDPIVLQPVKGGYLIITKWGLEGNDESIVNEINN